MKKKESSDREKNNKKVIMAIDVGNTTIAIAIMMKNRCLKLQRVSSKQAERILNKKIALIFNRLKKEYPTLRKAIVSSVVPKINTTLQRKLSQYKIDFILVGRDLCVPIRNRYHKPKQVGQDRLVIAFAAKQLYPCPCIIIDFGTAVTIDVISRSGHYEGGFILPGVDMSTSALSEQTALLPKLNKINTPRSLVGKNTQDCMLNGLVWGYRFMIEGIIKKLSQKNKKNKYFIVATGGHTSLMQYKTSPVDRIDKDLIFKGLWALHQFIEQ